MKPKPTYQSGLLALALTTVAQAQLNIPSDGSDGVFAPTADIEIDLSLAIPGTWSDDNTGANIGRGIYDKDQWAIVFEYSSVNIPVGVNVTFKNHPANPPVMWLVSGSVTINGVVSLEGESEFNNGLAGLRPNNGGPGGFRGGASGPSGTADGLGPGGGDTSGGDRFSVFRQGTFNYSNPQLVPLIGGSGGYGLNDGVAGGGGGGAILIASGSGPIVLNGTINCSGGDTFALTDMPMGSGGAIRLIASNVSGNGTLDCKPGDWLKSGPDDENFNTVNRSEGRIRIETPSLSPDITMFPETVAVPPTNPVLLFPPANAPTVRITSIGGIAVPEDPTAPLQATSDVAIENNDPVKVILETRNFPLEGVVQLRVGRKFGSAFWVNATLVGGTINQATWEVEQTFTDGFSALQARATAP